MRASGLSEADEAPTGTVGGDKLLSPGKSHSPRAPQDRWAAPRAPGRLARGRRARLAAGECLSAECVVGDACEAPEADGTLQLVAVVIAVAVALCCVIFNAAFVVREVKRRRLRRAERAAREAMEAEGGGTESSAARVEKENRERESERISKIAEKLEGVDMHFSHGAGGRMGGYLLPEQRGKEDSQLGKSTQGSCELSMEHGMGQLTQVVKHLLFNRSGATGGQEGAAGPAATANSVPPAAPPAGGAPVVEGN